MILKVNRIASSSQSTLSVMTLTEGEKVRARCFGIEDERREIKVSGETRIDSGKYLLTLRTVGGFNRRYAKKFGGKHYGMLWLREVPNFEYVLIHAGNAEKDTAGCLLPNLLAAFNQAGDFVGQRSVDAYFRIYTPLAGHLRGGGNAMVEVFDEDEDGGNYFEIASSGV